MYENCIKVLSHIKYYGAVGKKINMIKYLSLGSSDLHASNGAPIQSTV